MEQPIIAVICDDGSVKVVCLMFEPDPVRVQQEIEKIFSNPSYTERPVSWRFISASDLPEKLGDRPFRAALRDDGQKFTHDMPTARAICLDRLRAARTGKLSCLDRDWMRASGQKNTAEADRVEAKRQALRAFPETIAPVLAAAQDIEALKAIALPE